MFLKAKSNSDDITTWLTFGTDFTVTSVADLVSNVAAVCEPRMLQELVLYAHGVGGAFSVGPDRFGGISTPRDAEATLSRLVPSQRFFGGSVGRPRLILCVCDAGKNPANLLEVAKAIMQPVFACTSSVRPTLGVGYGWWDGDIVMADPFSLTVGTVDRIPEPPQILSLACGNPQAVVEIFAYCQSEPRRVCRRAKLSENCPLWNRHQRRRP